MELIPDIKSYDWGKIGNESEVAKLAVANSTKFNHNENGKCYFNFFEFTYLMEYFIYF